MPRSLMKHYWRLTSRMLHERGTIVLAMVFALLNAGGLGVGLLAIGPMLKIVLDPADPRTLADLARDYNAGGPTVAVPDWLIGLFPAADFDAVAMILLVVAGITVLGGISNFLHQYLSQTVATRTIARIRQEAFEHVVRMPLSRVLVRGPSEFVARIVRDTAELQRGMIALLSKAVTQVGKGMVALGVAVWTDARLTVIAVPTAVLMAVILRWLGRRIRKGTKRSLAAQESLLRVATEALQGLRAVKTSTAEEEATNRFSTINDDVVRHELKVRTARALSAPLVEVIAVLVVAGLALWAARAILHGHMALDSFLLTLGALGMAGASFRPLTGLVNEIQGAAAPAERLIDVLDEAREDARDSFLPVLGRHERSIEFRNVSVTYPGATHRALDSVSLTIRHGEHVAVVGPNGCGKSTLISLVPRLIAPDAHGGCVLIDGRDVSQVKLSSVRGQIGMVTQETMLLRGSIQQNIAMGREGADRSGVMEAARQAHALDFIERIPGGLDAQVLESGASLSGGQKQRLAIARAILRDPAILLLDEATSQVDAESEAAIHDAIRDFGRGRTVMVIAHRLSTVREADRIVVMDHGRIVDEGTHDELLGRCGLYARLSRTQLVEAANG